MRTLKELLILVKEDFISLIDDFVADQCLGICVSIDNLCAHDKITKEEHIKLTTYMHGYMYTLDEWYEYTGLGDDLEDNYIAIKVKQNPIDISYAWNPYDREIRIKWLDDHINNVKY